VAEAFENHKRELETEKTNIETELDILEIDQKILDSLKEKKLRSITVSEELNLSRQYTASRLSHLIDSGFVKRTKRGRSVYYSLITS
jgi:predicted transcriptional regulator